ncbi:MAG: hypothetical protein JNL72_00215 [Flavipsychrobacter sp.]|nr:hypothetical protein [Flavipsychrobacter sp.]
MADVYLFYKYTTPNTRHSFNAGAGVSYCWGINDIVKVFWINPDPPYDAVTYLESKKAEYWGVVPYLGYDYQFWKNRIVIGPDIRARIYSGRPSVEYNINFHLGVNF